MSNARNEYKVRDGLRDLGEFKLFLVVLDPDSGVHGPFSTDCEAFEFAEHADGSVFECRARLTSAVEIY
jgi:hypothetical protein